MLPTAENTIIFERKKQQLKADQLFFQEIEGNLGGVKEVSETLKPKLCEVFTTD